MASTDFVYKAMATSHCSFSGADTASEYLFVSWIKDTKALV